MWGVFSLPDPCNKEKKWDLFLHQYIFPLDYVKHHVNNVQKFYKADKYMVHNLTCSELYLRSNLSSSLLQGILKLVPLIATGPEVYISTMTNVLYYSYYSLVDNLNHVLICLRAFLKTFYMVFQVVQGK